MLARILAQPIACLLLALISAVILLAALGLQYLGGLAPCHLCVLQRWPYVVLVALGLVGWRWQPRLVLGLSIVALLAGAGLAAYHFGIEQGWWALPESCVAGGSAQSLEELKRMLAEAAPTCDQVRFTLLGLTLAGWNFLTSVALAAYAAAAALNLDATPHLRSIRINAD
ncbi:MAG TPA: disulfide bond formation protein B [Geminicoccaceae bacterium]|jgi:disulfide bond formation protein DsbB|nr:disulfide bond formation protein B [Geminicoccaceae bacterium]